MENFILVVGYNATTKCKVISLIPKLDSLGSYIKVRVT